MWQLGLEISSWTETDALVWKHTWKEKSSRMEHAEWKSGVEDTRAIHNARTSAEMRPTDKFDGKWRDKKKTMEKRERTYERGNSRVTFRMSSFSFLVHRDISLFLDFAI